MSTMMDVMEVGDRFLTMARGGEVRLWCVRVDGTVVEVKP